MLISINTGHTTAMRTQSVRVSSPESRQFVMTIRTGLTEIERPFAPLARVDQLSDVPVRVRSCSRLFEAFSPVPRLGDSGKLEPVTRASARLTEHARTKRRRRNWNFFFTLQILSFRRWRFHQSFRVLSTVLVALLVLLLASVSSSPAVVPPVAVAVQLGQARADDEVVNVLDSDVWK